MSRVSWPIFFAFPGYSPVESMPPSERARSLASKPATSSPCQQLMDMGICFTFLMAISVSTPKLVYLSLAS